MEQLDLSTGAGRARCHRITYARHMGFEVAAIGRGADKAELAKKLGAHHYIDNAATDYAEALQAFGGAKVRERRPGDGGSLQAAHQELHHLLELSLPVAEAGGDQRYH